MFSFSALLKSLRIFPRTISYVRLANKKENDIELIKKAWAEETLSRLNVQTRLINLPSEEPSLLYLGNHISYLDIPVLLQYVPHLSFVAKSEVADWPIIGSAAKKANTVFVDREHSVKRVKKESPLKSSPSLAIYNSLKQGKRIAIFPSGTTSIDESKPWKSGAFKIAARGNFKIQPFRIKYSSPRTAAYIDDDNLILHLMKMSQADKIEATLEFHEPVYLSDLERDMAYWRKWSQSSFNSKLTQTDLVVKPETIL